MPKYLLLVPRYIDGRYVHASREHPVEIELEEPRPTQLERNKDGKEFEVPYKVDEHGKLKDKGLVPIGEAPAPLEKLKPHYAEKPATHIHSAPVPPPVEEKAKAAAPKSKRASDNSPV